MAKLLIQIDDELVKGMDLDSLKKSFVKMLNSKKIEREMNEFGSKIKVQIIDS